jgi:ferredoxin-NADP reductase/nitrite reductase/ring-hydroxylating ferredoxin subunit
MARHVIGRASDLPEGGRLLVELQGRSIGIFHINGRYHALLNRCPHMGAEVCRGSVLGHLTASGVGAFHYDDSRLLVRCPWHGWEYDLETGQSYFDSRVRPYPIDLVAGEEVAPDATSGEVELLDDAAAAQIATGLGAPQLRPGPYVVERFPVALRDEYLVVTMPGGRSGRPSPVLREVELVAIEPEAPDIVSLTLAPPPGEPPLEAWKPGAHIGLVLADGLERQYSLCGDSGAETWQVAVLHELESRGGSRHVHERLRPGDRLQVRGPRNGFPLVEARGYLFIAGGIGITPLLPMIGALQARGAPWRLHYGGRSRATMAFLDSLASYGDRVTLWPEDELGLIDLTAVLADLGDGDGDGDAVYCCGPDPLLRAVEDRCAHLPAGTLHLERFHPAPPAVARDAAFKVVLAASGLTVAVAEDETIVQALERVGVPVATSCREGTCGTCETVLLEGQADHRDAFLSEPERAAQETVMICCSRAHGERLVLDV